MKIKYNYFQLRFPYDIAVILQRISTEFDAVYMDIPYLLPKESHICKFNGGKTIVFDNKVFCVATNEVDVCFENKRYSDGRFFGLINISSGYPCYILWTTFLEKNLDTILSGYNVDFCVRTYSTPARTSVTLKWRDINV